MNNTLKILAIACLTLFCASCKKDNGPAVNDRACFVTIPDMKPLTDNYSCSVNQWDNLLFVPFDGDNVLNDGDFVTISILGDTMELFDYMIAPADDHGLDGDAVCYGFFPTKIFIQGQSAVAKIVYDDGKLKFEKELKLIADSAIPVDLGLSVKWAPFNVGALAAGGLGLYFAWGDTADRKNFQWTKEGDYKWGIYSEDNSYASLTKYTGNGVGGDGLTTLQPGDDPATSNWGSRWRSPSVDEVKELLDKTKCEWTWDEARKGCVVRGLKTGNSIFLPSTGSYVGSTNMYLGSDGDYWTSSLNKENPNTAYYFRFNSVDVILYDGNRCFGRSVRAVAEY